MSPLDRIAQLNARVAELETANALLRSQLADGQEQAKRDSATIARIAEHNEEMVSALIDSKERWQLVAPMFKDSERFGVRADVSIALIDSVLQSAQ